MSALAVFMTAGSAAAIASDDDHTSVSTYLGSDCDHPELRAAYAEVQQNFRSSLALGYLRQPRQEPQSQDQPDEGSKFTLLFSPSHLHSFPRKTASAVAPSLTYLLPSQNFVYFLLHFTLTSTSFLRKNLSSSPPLIFSLSSLASPSVGQPH